MGIDPHRQAIYRQFGRLTVPGLFDAPRTDAAIRDIEAWGEQVLADLPPAQRAWYVDGGVTARTVLRKLDNPHHHRETIRALAFHRPLVEAAARSPRAITTSTSGRTTRRAW